MIKDRKELEDEKEDIREMMILIKDLNKEEKTEVRGILKGLKMAKEMGVPA